MGPAMGKEKQKCEYGQLFFHNKMGQGLASLRNRLPACFAKCVAGMFCKHIMLSIPVVCNKTS